jgi:hypothetical protein
MAINPLKAPPKTKAPTPEPKPKKVLTPAEKRAASTANMVKQLQASLDNGTATGSPNAKLTVQNPINSGIGTGIVNARVPIQNSAVNGSVSGTNKDPRFSKKPPGKKNPQIEDPALPPFDSTGTPLPTSAPQPAPQPYMNKDWSKVVSHYFPETEGMKAGGLVRGGGCAVKGSGRGKIV